METNMLRTCQYNQNTYGVIKMFTDNSFNQMFIKIINSISWTINVFDNRINGLFRGTEN